MSRSLHKLQGSQFSPDPRNSAVAKYSRNQLRGPAKIAVTELQTDRGLQSER
ncbi:hypothetical protein ElyMa_003326000, partial [Elysia marginata]